MVTVGNIYDYLDKLYHFSSQSDWDNSGLLVGSRDKQVGKVAIMLDATPVNITKAINNDVDLILCHHPLMFKPIQQLGANDPAYRLARNDIALIAIHTPWDMAKDGVNFVLANTLGLERIEVLQSDESLGMIKLGYLPHPMHEPELAEYIKQKLGIPFVKFTSTKELVKKVAVCGGAGAEFMDEVVHYADAYVTSDIKYHEFLHAKDIGLTVFDAGHFNTEDPSMNTLSVKIAMEFADIKVLRLKSVDPISYK